MQQGNKGTRIAHLNSLKRFVEREVEIEQLTVLAESDTDKDQLGDKGCPTRLEGEGSCEGFSQAELDNVLAWESTVQLYQVNQVLHPLLNWS